MASATVKELAGALGLTPRRILQLVDERVLPAVCDGAFADVDLCKRRYRLLSRGPSADWQLVFDDVVALAETSEELIARALAVGASLIDVAVACESVSALWSWMNFITAVRSDTQSERAFFFGQWDREEARILSALLERAQELNHGAELLPMASQD
jgi:hypothetical protein